MRNKAFLLCLPVVLCGLLLRHGAVLAQDPAENHRAVLKPVAPITWQDLNGKKYDIGGTAKSKATVFFFTSTQCPVSNVYTPRMSEIAQAYSAKGIQFFLVNSNSEDTLPVLREYARQRKFPFPVIKDDGTKLADALVATRTPEAVVMDSEAIVRYRGGIDDNADRSKIIRHTLQEALDALLAGKPIVRGRTASLGCAIFHDKPAMAQAGIAKVTYAHDVAPILNANCVTCHRPGESGPFSLETYPQAKTWASAIKAYTVRRQMPPWKAVAGYGEFHDARTLTDAQIATLAKWADSGAPSGDLKTAPPIPARAAHGWLLGEPGKPGDPGVVLQSEKPYELAAEGRDVYRQFVLPIDNNQDIYLRGIEFRAENPVIVHHIILYFDTSGKSVDLVNATKDGQPGYSVDDGTGGIGIPFFQSIWVAGWAPGNTARFLPEGMAFKLPKGAKVVLQVHYHKNGAVQKDQSRVALHFADARTVKSEVHTGALLYYMLNLKPGVADQQVATEQTLRQDTTIIAVMPHMHMLGRNMKMIATTPDGKETPLVYINDWDFNWQETYRYTHPLDFPRGTKLKMTATFDNTEQNARQPSHPPKEVHWGEQTTDEMCIGFYQFTVPHPSAESAASR